MPKGSKIFSLAALVFFFLAVFFVKKSVSVSPNRELVAQSKVIKLISASNDSTIEPTTSNENANLNDEETSNKNSNTGVLPDQDQEASNSNSNDNLVNPGSDFGATQNGDDANQNDNSNSNANENGAFGDNGGADSGATANQEPDGSGAGQAPENDNSDQNNNLNDNRQTNLALPDFSVQCPERVKAGENFEVSVNTEEEVGENVLSYFWSQDRGEEGEEAEFKQGDQKINLSFNKPGSHSVTVKVENQFGENAQKECSVDVSNPDLAGKLKIIGILPNPWGADNAPKPNGEKVWLRNTSAVYIDVAGFVLYDADDTHELFITSENVENAEGNLLVPPGENLLLYRDGDADFSLNNDADTLRLYSGPLEMLGELLDETNYRISGGEGKTYWRNLESNTWEEVALSLAPSALFCLDSGQNFKPTERQLSFGTKKMILAQNEEEDSAIWDQRPNGGGEGDFENPVKSGIDWGIISKASAEEISQVIDTDFADFSLERIKWLPGDLDQSSFWLENQSSTAQKIYLGAKISSPGTATLDPSLWFVEIKKGEECLWGCAERVNLQDLAGNSRLIEEIGPRKKENFSLQLMFGSGEEREAGKEMEVQFFLEREETPSNEVQSGVAGNGGSVIPTDTADSADSSVVSEGIISTASIEGGQNQAGSSVSGNSSLGGSPDFAKDRLQLPEATFAQGDNGDNNNQNKSTKKKKDFKKKKAKKEKKNKKGKEPASSGVESKKGNDALLKSNIGFFENNKNDNGDLFPQGKILTQMNSENNNNENNNNSNNPQTFAAAKKEKGSGNWFWNVLRDGFVMRMLLTWFFLWGTVFGIMYYWRKRNNLR